ncbi:uridine kinase [Biformimicrobium ophioploci]|uniref:Uridine kinase n=2 Tax=Biformimicrobium ophioploci TaxID=3036711 RepID=A0ABQ6LZ21_9GAMM|nr:uridine kinase [Microbulbifer sp. NKW57]
MLLVGIAGASASGKSLLAKTLARSLPADQVSMISEDSYYRDQSHLTMEERASVNYDHPSSMDHELLTRHLEALKAGQAVDVPVYDYSIHTRSDKAEHVTPTCVVIVEGILLFTDSHLRDWFDVKLFMDTPLDICLIRRLHRDIEERGRTLQSVLQQYVQFVRPMYLQFIEPSRQHADLIIPRGGKNEIALDLIRTRLHAQLG